MCVPGNMSRASAATRDSHAVCVMFSGEEGHSWKLVAWEMRLESNGLESNKQRAAVKMADLCALDPSMNILEWNGPLSVLATLRTRTVEIQGYVPQRNVHMARGCAAVWQMLASRWTRVATNLVLGCLYNAKVSRGMARHVSDDGLERALTVQL